MTEPSSDDAKVQQWIAWLDHGVTLRIPETSIPYCDVHQSTLRTLGAGRYERADEWTSFEAGHGRYGSTDLQPLDEPTLRALLLEFARRCPLRVRPLDEHATPVIDAAEALALVREGRHSISPWFAGADRSLHNAVFGANGEAYRVTSKLAKFVAVEWLDPAADQRLKGLCIARSTLLDPAPILLERARRHCQRRDELLREIASAPRLATVTSGASARCKAGRRAAGLVFYELDHRQMVQELDEHELRRNVAHALIAADARAVEGECSMYVCFDAQPERFHRVDERFRDAVRALVAARAQ